MLTRKCTLGRQLSPEAQFVIVWTSSPTADVAALILNQPVEDVIEEADYMRDAGVRLKPTVREPAQPSTLPPFEELVSNPTASLASFLNDEQKKVFFDHLETAAQGAYAKAKKEFGIGCEAIRTSALDDIVLERWARRVEVGNMWDPRQCAYATGKYVAASYFATARRSPAWHGVYNLSDESHTGSKYLECDMRKLRQGLSEELVARSSELPETRNKCLRLAVSLGLDRKVSSQSTLDELKEYIRGAWARGETPSCVSEWHRCAIKLPPYQRFVAAWSFSDCVINAAKRLKISVLKALRVAECLRAARVCLKVLPIRHR